MESPKVKEETDDYSPQSTSTVFTDLIGINSLTSDFEHLRNVEEANTATANLIAEECSEKDQFHNCQELGVNVLSESSSGDPTAWLPEQTASTNNANGLPQVSGMFSSGGQQYAVIDASFNVGGPNAYYVPGMQCQWQQFNSNTPSSTSTSTDNQSLRSSSSCSQAELDINPNFPLSSLFGNGDGVFDEEMHKEQKRKRQMKKRRQEKNKECSKNFRRKQRGKEVKLKEGKVEKENRLRMLWCKTEKMTRQLLQVAHHGCGKAEIIAAAGFAEMEKENTAAK